MTDAIQIDEDKVTVTVRCPHHPQYDIHVELPKTRTFGSITVPFAKCVRTIFIGCTDGTYEAVKPDTFDFETTMSVKPQLCSVDFDYPPITFPYAARLRSSETIQMYMALDAYVAEVITDSTANSPQYIEHVHKNNYVSARLFTGMTGLSELEQFGDTAEVFNRMRERHVARVRQGSSTAQGTTRKTRLSTTSLDDEGEQVEDAPLPIGQQRPAKQRKS